jgi:hypothetical protein
MQLSSYFFFQLVYMEWEFPSDGAQFWNAGHTAYQQNFSITNAVVMLLVDIVLYALLVGYFDNVLPGTCSCPLPKMECFFEKLSVLCKAPLISQDVDDFLYSLAVRALVYQSKGGMFELGRTHSLFHSLQ